MSAQIHKKSKMIQVRLEKFKWWIINQKWALENMGEDGKKLAESLGDLQCFMDETIGDAEETAAKTKVTLP